jgi:enoyl-CoA hydratase/carnithine racemase
MSAVLCERHEGWAELILNRPERRNAIDGTLAVAMLDTLRALEADPSIRAVVMRGAGGAFCSGLDVKALNADPPPPWKADFPSRWTAVHEALIESRKVLVVALERYAINGGAALALAGDLLVAGGSAYLQVGEVQIGMPAPRNVAWLALRHGEATVARVCLVGDRIDAAEMKRLNLATEVVADDAVVARAQALAQRIGSYPAEAVASIKTSIRAASAQVAPGRWFAACAAADPLAGVLNAPPRSMAGSRS